MIACLEAIFTRIGKLTASFSKEGGRLSCSVFQQHGSFSFERVDTGFTASATRLTGMRASFGIVCSVGLDDYILWASDDMVLNVYGDKIYLTRKWQND